MALITFMSDFGYQDHYVAAVKARIFSLNPAIPVIDITHQIKQFDISHGVYVLSSVFRDFPKGTVHLVSVHMISQESKLVAIELEGHFFVGVDTGLFSLLSTKQPSIIVELNKEGTPEMFPEKGVLTTTAVNLASGQPIEELGIRINEVLRFNNLQLRISKTAITGNVIHIDAYGNLITNISIDVFEKELKSRKYFVGVGRERIEGIGNTYVTGSGECIALFNSNGMLEISIAEGNASELLGIHGGYPVHINFTGES